MAKAVTLEQLDIPAGKVKHARLLERFVAQDPAAALPVLLRCVAEGSKAMRAAGWSLLAQTATPQAERLALEGAAGAEALKVKDKKAALEGLRAVATPAALRRLAALGEELDPVDLGPDALERAAPWLPEWLAALDGEQRHERVLALAREVDIPHEDDEAEARAAAVEATDPSGALAFLRGLLDAPATEAALREALLHRLVERGDLPSCRRPDVSPSQRGQALANLPSAECFERLAPLVRAGAESLEGVLLRHAPDERWVALAQELPAGPQLALLLRLPSQAAVAPALALLVAQEWSLQAWQWLLARRALEQPLAAPVLLHWLETSRGFIYDSDLLQPLEAIGQREHLARLEALAATRHRPIYAPVLAAIRARAG